MLLLISCDDNRLDIDISGSRVDVGVYRMEEDLFLLGRTQQADQDLQTLEARYGNFLSLFTAGVLGIGQPDDPGFLMNLNRFVEDPEMSAVYDDIQTSFHNIDDLRSEFSEAFSHFHHYFPDSIIPRIVTLHTGFNYAVIAADSTLGIGLDMYLGVDYRYYPRLNFPAYKVRRMRREYIVPDGIRSWIATGFFPEEAGTNTLDHIIQHGKVWYLTEAMIPDYPDSLITGFSAVEVEWCRENEESLWAFMVDQQLVYSVKTEEINKLVSEGPFTPGMPRESPGGAGRWIGWQMVRSYMDRHPDATLQDLIEIPAAELLKRSGYRP